MSRLLGVLALALTAACGGGTDPDPGGTNCPANTICMTNSAFTPMSRTVDVNTAVTWNNDSNQRHNVTFATPSAALGVGGGAGGNFDAPTSSTNQRQFAVPGTYNFHCNIHGTATSGMRGSVVVE